MPEIRLRRKRLIGYYAASIFVLLFTLVITFLIYGYFKRINHERSEHLLEIRSVFAKNLLETTLNDYVQVLRDAKGLVLLNDTISRREWKNYFNETEVPRYFPGMLGLGLTTIVPPEIKDRHEDIIRREGFPDFKIFPAGKRDVYTSIIYLEPFDDRNRRAFGFDMYTERVRRQAMNRAIQTGKVAMSGKVTLVQENNSKIQPGFLLFNPVFKKDTAGKPYLYGFVYSPFRVYDLIDRGIFKKDFRDLTIKIYDGIVVHDSTLMFDNRIDAHGSLKTRFVQVLRIAGHNWTIVTGPSTSFGFGLKQQQPVFILISGVVISFLIFLIMVILSTARKNAILVLERTRQLEQKRDEFIGIASHELKTPLTSIKAYLQIIRDAIKKKGDSQLQEYVGKTINHVDKLGYLVSDLLDVSKIHAGKIMFNFKDVRFDEFLKDGIETARHLAPRHKISVEGHSDKTIFADPQRLEQVFINLISNAVKYSPESDRLDILVHDTPTEVVLGVRDYGIGIPKEKAGYIFERFYRIDDHSYRFSGLGIGLYISAEIVHRHNGRIWVESNKPKGSIFYFSLPVKQANAAGR